MPLGWPGLKVIMMMVLKRWKRKLNTHYSSAETKKKKRSFTGCCWFLLADHLLHRHRFHDQVGTLHDQASVLVLSGMQKQAALVEEGQPFGAVITRHLNPERAPIVVLCQALLQGEGIAALQAAVTLQGIKQPPQTDVKRYQTKLRASHFKLCSSGELFLHK